MRLVLVGVKEQHCVCVYVYVCVSVVYVLEGEGCMEWRG